MGRRDNGSARALLPGWVRSQLWPLPTAGVVLAFGLGILLPYVDEELGGALPGSVRELLFGGGPDAASTVLDAVASSMITVTSLTFSLTVVTLQLASSQFSPRLLRTFASDLFVQVTLALFLATFTFALTVLRTVRTEDDQQAEFVPHLSVTVAFLLVIASVLGLVLFLAHLAQVIRVETMLRRVRDEATDTVRHNLADLDEEDEHGPPAATPPRPEDAVVLLAPRSGFLTGVDRERLVTGAADLNVTVWLDRPSGAHVVAGTPIGVVAAGSGAPTAPVRERLAELAQRALRVGTERSGGQDIGFGLRQLTDVAVKALSPGINDPTTAVHALGHSSALLCALAGRRLGPEPLTDADGQLRVVLARPTLADLLEVALAQPRRYGRADPDVLERIAAVLGEVAWVARPADREAVRAQADRLRRTVADADVDDTERRRLEDALTAVHRALARAR